VFERVVCPFVSSKSVPGRCRGLFFKSIRVEKVAGKVGDSAYCVTMLLARWTACHGLVTQRTAMCGYASASEMEATTTRWRRMPKRNIIFAQPSSSHRLSLSPCSREPRQ
jgi:hypothetical protein